MAELPLKDNVPDNGSVTASKSSSSGSESSSTEEEERLRRLFQACDRDHDGFIDSHDLLHMCELLGMEESVDEVMTQLGIEECGQISFEEFVRCRMALVTEIEQERMREERLGRLTHSRPTTNLLLPGGSSNNSLGLPPSSGDYDSGARDLSPEPTSLYKLFETHEPEVLQRIVEHAESCETLQGPNFMEVANSLHLAALTSLKGEIIELSNKLQHVSTEKEVLEKQLSRQQTEKFRLQRESQDKLDQQTVRYEDRITELHSVIAELQKKLDRHQINVIREEDEFEETSDNHSPSNKSLEDISVNENNANISQADSIVELGNDLNAELSRVVSELESAISERKQIAGPQPPSTDSVGVQPNSAYGSLEEKTIQVVHEVEDLSLSDGPPPLPPPPMMDVATLEREMERLRAENTTYRDQIGRQETELNKLRASLGSMREEKDKLKRRVRELQTCVQNLGGTTSPLHSRTSTPTRSSMVQPCYSDRTSGVSSEAAPIAKVAELKKLKTGSAGERQVTGAEISSLGLPNSKVAEHLVQTLQECSNVQEIIQTVYHCGNQISENKVKEFEIELERLQSKIDNLKSQNDLLSLTLDESKFHCDRLTVLMGKYESNFTAIHLVLNYTDQVIETYEVLVSLLETDKGILLANCRAAGLGSIAGNGATQNDEQEEIQDVLKKSHLARKEAEHTAKQHIQRMERQSAPAFSGCTSSPWEDLSSNSRTASSTTSSTGSSVDTEFTRHDEQKLKDSIQLLKNDRGAVKMTIMELQSVHINPVGYDSAPNPDAQRLDLENAVLMQELMAMKEEKAELKAQNYLLEKEKAALELQLSGKESQEQAYLVQIEHLKCEIKETQQYLSKDGSLSSNASHGKKEFVDDSTTPAITLAELRSSHQGSLLSQDLSEALKREKKLKARVQELVVTLEKLSRNSEIRHQQSAEFVNDLKRANSALVSAFEKAKKKYQSKVKKLELQMQAMQQRYEHQMAMYKQRVIVLEDEVSRTHTNETSL